MDAVAKTCSADVPRELIAGPPIALVANDPWHDRFHLLMAGAAVVTAVLWLAGFLCCRLTASWDLLLPILGMLCLVLAGAGQYRWRGEVKCFQILMMVFWSILLTNGHFFPMYMAARSGAPLNDALLAHCDRMLGIEVPTVMAALADYPSLNGGLLFIYKTLLFLIVLATLLPPMANRIDLAKQYLVSCMIAAAVSLPIFACVQAVGPWDYYGFPPAIESLSQKSGILAALHSADPFHIDLGNRDGLITFPSFHVVLTVLAAAVLWPFRPLRWPVTVWAALIVISTVTTGIHYAIDVVGGLLLAAVSFLGARAFLKWHASTAKDSASIAAEK